MNSEIFDSVVVSTDSEEIAQVARTYGAEVPFLRSPENADDHVSMASPIFETLERLSQCGRRYDAICCLLATGPFVSPDLIINGYEKLHEVGNDSVIAVQKNPHPIKRSLTVSDKGMLDMLWDEYRLTRSQDLEDTYHDAAQMYWARTQQFLKERSFLTKCTAAIVLGELDAHDIDTPEDWDTAEKLWQFMNYSKK